MRRRLVLAGLGWLAGTMAAVGMGVQAVQVVTASVTGQRPDPLSAAAVSAALTESGPTPAAPAPADGSPTTGSSTPTTRPTPAATGPSRPTTTTTPVTPISPTTGTTTPTATPATTPTTTPTVPLSPTTSTSTTRPSTAPAEDRTYQLTGGRAGVRFENGRARLLWATPETGFRVDSSGSDSQVDVRFRSEDHESRLHAFWRDGPQAEIEERPR